MGALTDLFRFVVCCLGIATGTFLWTLPGSVSAHDLRIENVAFIAAREAPDTLWAVFDVSWEHAWHHERNHDAAWIYLKLRLADGTYTHVTLAPTGHRVIERPGRASGPAEIDVADDGTGFFVYPKSPYRGHVAWRLKVAFHPEAVEAHYAEARLNVFGLEMVFIPEGHFALGDPGPRALDFGAFYRAGPEGEPAGLFAIESESALSVGPHPGHLFYRSRAYEGDGEGPIPAAFPKGYHAFYAMKYELLQGQYAAFLNTLPDDATYERVNFGGRTYFDKRGTIRLEDGIYLAGHPDRPMNFLSWDDGLAFADWAGLRPMTEFEFTKACRGSESPLPGAFPWGTANRDVLARLVAPDDALVMVNGWDEQQLTNSTRPVFGASFYWVMDLAGSVWERVITVGRPDGRAFEGSHGDGRLGEVGRATNADWPHTYLGREGHGYRGGGFYDQGRSIHEFNPHSPVAYRRFGAWSGAAPYRAYGFRAVRTAP